MDQSASSPASVGLVFCSIGGAFGVLGHGVVAGGHRIVCALWHGQILSFLLYERKKNNPSKYSCVSVLFPITLL
jgi:hypothetical protein